MAVTSNRTSTVNLSGDLVASLSFDATENQSSPGVSELKTLAPGANTISLPTGGSTVVSATIVPPTGNTQTITLKGVTGDTGVALHKTDPTVIALDAGVTNFVLTAGGTITGLRIIWA